MTIRWGIIGCGSVCEVKSGPPLREVPGSSVSVVMRRDPGQAKDYAARHSIARWTTDADSVLGDPAVDAIYVATPPGGHAEYAIAAAKAGKPCYVEKPMARHAPECDAMLAAFETARLPLFVAYYRRALPRFLHLQKLLREERIGTPLSISVHYSRDRTGGTSDWRYDAAQSGGGLLLDLGSHTLDILDFLFGPIIEVAGHAQRNAEGPGVEDTVVVAGRFESGPLLSGSWAFAAHENRDDIAITGTRGRIHVSTFGDTPIELYAADSSEVFPFTNPRGIQAPLIATIISELQGKRGACPSTGYSAARTSRVMDSMLSSYYGGREDAFWERVPRHQPRAHGGGRPSAG